MSETRFKIVIPSYNNSEWVEYNVASILNQTYTNYDVLYINDASTDTTLNDVNNIVSSIPNWNVVSNPINRRRGFNVSPYNYHLYNFMSELEDVLVFVDGDDWLYDDTVLEQLNEFYVKHDVWMAYGGMVCYPSGNVATPQNTPYSDHVHNSNLYRSDRWRASHLRTFKWHLYKKIKYEDMIYTQTNDYYFHAEDLATSFPCLEMCPTNKIGVLDFYSYVFNESIDNRNRGVQREHEAGNALELEIRNRYPYNITHDK